MGVVPTKKRSADNFEAKHKANRLSFVVENTIDIIPKRNNNKHKTQGMKINILNENIKKQSINKGKSWFHRPKKVNFFDSNDKLRLKKKETINLSNVKDIGDLQDPEVFAKEKDKVYINLFNI